MYTKLSEEERAEWRKPLQDLLPRYQNVPDAYREIKRLVIAYIDSRDAVKNESERKFSSILIPADITDEQLRLLSQISVEVALLDIEDEIIHRFCSWEITKHGMTDEETACKLGVIHDDLKYYIKATYGPFPFVVSAEGIEAAVFVIRAETPATLIRDNFDALVEKHMVRQKTKKRP